MAEVYGASQEAWHHWSVTLGLAEHLLPVVANPGATISPDSKVQLLGKTPSKYNFRGETAGFPKWTQHAASMRDIGQWEQQSDYGICVQARAVRAIDIDVPGPKRSRRIVETIENTLPLHNWMYRRTREGTGKLLLPFLYEGELPKAVLQVEGGMVEMLGDGQQWIAESSYLVGDKKGQKVDGRYLWPAGWPARLEDLPLLTAADVEELRATLELLHGTGEWQIARMKRDKPIDRTPRPGSADSVADWLLANWEIRDEGREGELFVRCPFDAEHTSDSGPTETVYYPSGTGGYERGHFKCLHAHCMARSDDDYLAALGYSIADEFPIVVDEPGTEIEKAEPPAARYLTDNKGRKENRAYNHELFLRSAESPFRIAWDDFTANVIRAPKGDPEGEERWKLFADEHYSTIVRAMDRNGFVPQSPSALRPAVHSYAMSNAADMAIEWAQRLPAWDGVERVETFWIDYAGVADSEYIRAVGRYSWTAQAGRLLDPGCQADMAPILVGEQGVRKTSLIAAIAPSRQWFTEINLLERDDDTSRKMRGKLVAELGELRGMHARDVEDVKAFITRREEEWVPKYQEFARSFKRRFVFYGSTNRDAFLGDPTGERRWLPFNVGERLDVEGVERDRDQLWAEAIHRWRTRGVEWQDAERLAAGEHEKFKEHDEWTAQVVRWLLEDDPLNGGAPVDRDYEWGTNDVLVGALGMRAKDLNRGLQSRAGAVLTALGCWKKKVWKKGNMYRAFREKLEAETDEVYQ
jgi:hypothetical protein